MLLKESYLWLMITIGKFNDLKVLREKPAGLFLEGTDEGILLPKRFVPKDAHIGNTISVFLYHDSEGRLIATTQQPMGMLDDIVRLKVVNITGFGAFLDFGLMKDLFIPKSNMRSFMRPQGWYFVKIILDQKTGRLSATEYFEKSLVNDPLSIKEMEQVDLTIYRRTNIGFETIINNKHKGILHFNEVFRPLQPGDRLKGFVKKIFKNEKTGETLIDVVTGKPGYDRVDDESEKILNLLRSHDGYLPFYDKSDPEAIYDFFGMSKKTFKMAIGKLYKAQLIDLTSTGIRLVAP